MKEYISFFNHDLPDNNLLQQLQQKVYRLTFFLIKFQFQDKNPHQFNTSEKQQMSFRDEDQQYQSKQDHSTEQYNQKPYTASIINNKVPSDVNNFVVSHHLQRSNYAKDYDLQEQDEKLKKKQQYQLKLDNSQSSQRQANKYQNKNYSNKENEKTQIKKDKVYESQPEQYQSISSDKSDKEEENQNKNINEQIPKNTIEIGNILNKPDQQEQRPHTKMSIQQRLKLMRNRTSETNLSKNYDKKSQNNQTIKEFQKQENHATFKLSSSIPKSSPYSSKISNSSSQITHRSQYLQNKLSSQYNIKNDDDQDIGTKFPSILKSNSSKQSPVSSTQKKEMNFQQSLNYLRSSKNSKSSQHQIVLGNKSISQEEYPPLGSENVHYINYQPKKVQHQEEQVMMISQVKQESKNTTNVKVQSQNSQQPSLFYVSVSTQQMYPSLDLKQKAKLIDTKRSQNLTIIKEEAQKPEIKQSTRGKVTVSISKPVSDPNLPSQIRILSYRSQFFLKIETQIFTIQIRFPPTPKKDIELKQIGKRPNRSQQQPEPQEDFNIYQIERRFSDFVFLYEGIMINHLGYIIYPFPEKSLESFIKIKLNSLIGTSMSDGNAQAEKVQMIQRRIEELQKFVNFIINHQQLRYSEELAIFLCNDPELYRKSRQRIQKYIQEYQELQNSTNLLQESKKNIKKAFQTGFNFVQKWWGSSVEKETSRLKNSQKAKQSRQIIVSSELSSEDIQFGQYLQRLSIFYSKFAVLQKNLLKLLETEQKFMTFKDIDTEFEYLVKLCTKVSSGKEFNKSLIQVLELDLIKDIITIRKWLQQTKIQLLKRQQLKQLIETLKQSLIYTNDASSKISKLQRRLERFEKNFRFGFAPLLTECEKVFQIAKNKFLKQWCTHCSKMKKIWK